MHPTRSSWRARVRPFIPSIYKALLLMPLALLAQSGEATTPGLVDPSFGIGGKVITQVGTGSDIARKVMEDSSGRLVVAGSVMSDGKWNFGLVRYTASGTLDESFGIGGKVITPVGQADAEIRSLIEDDSGRLILAGSAHNGSDSDFALVRYTASGELDSSFGSNGIVTTPLSPSNDDGYFVYEDRSGRLLVAGISNNDGAKEFALVRYTASGALDTSFGNGGRVTTPIAPAVFYPTSMAADSRGRLLFVGSTQEDSNSIIRSFAVARYTASGVLDTSFGNGGAVITPIGVYSAVAESVIEDSKGRLVAVGDAYDTSPYDGGHGNVAVVRYTASGALDTSFGSGGKVTTVVGLLNSDGKSVIEDASGRLVVAGFADNGNDPDFALLRYSANGVLDTTFNGTGKVLKSFRPDVDGSLSVIEDSSGRLVAAGFSRNGSYSDIDFAIARFHGNNERPVANAGGPYVVDEGQSLILDASGSTDESGIVDYRWDLDNDGWFDDAMGAVVDLGVQSSAMATYTIRLLVRDGNWATDTDSTTVTVQVPGPDTDGDGFNDSVDAFPTDNAEWQDSDNDGVGNNADQYDDNPYASRNEDGDEFPDDCSGNCGGLTADPSLGDSDNDGVGNSEDLYSDNPYASRNDDGDEFPDDCTGDCGGLTQDPSLDDSDNDGILDGEDYQVGDNNPPVVTPPADIALISTGELTEVMLGMASLQDVYDSAYGLIGSGPTPDTPDAATTVNLPPGRHIIIWRAIDWWGNQAIAEQTVELTPLVGFTESTQLIAEGSLVTVAVSLNGDAVSYPVVVPLILDGSSTALNPNDHDGVTNSIVIEEDAEPANQGSYQFVIGDDGMTGEPAETVIFRIVENNELGENSELMGAAIDEARAQQVITATENIAPEITGLSARKGRKLLFEVFGPESGSPNVEVRGDIVLRAQLTDANPDHQHSYTWIINGVQLGDATREVLLTESQYRLGRNSIEVQALDDGSPPEYSNRFSVEIYVDEPKGNQGSSGGGSLGGLPLAIVAALLLLSRMWCGQRAPTSMTRKRDTVVSLRAKQATRATSFRNHGT